MDTKLKWVWGERKIKNANIRAMRQNGGSINMPLFDIVHE